MKKKIGMAALLMFAAAVCCSCANLVSDNEAFVVFSEEQLNQLPTGGHFQGIQCLVHNGQHYLFLSHDSTEEYAYLVIAAQVSDHRWDVQKVLPVEYDRDDLPGPLKHAGGFQIYNDYLAVGIEDNSGKKDSRIIFYDISSPLDPVQLSNLTIQRNSDIEKAKTAGAVALTGLTIHGKYGYLTAVANWDSRDMDFYFLEGDLNRLNESPYPCNPFFNWKSDKADKSVWKPDQKWGSYQAINFVQDSQQNLYLLCTRTGSKILGRDYIDYFSVAIHEDLRVELVKLAGKQMQMGLYHPWSKNAHYIYGGGLFVPDPETLISLATARSVSGDSLKIVISLGIHCQGQ